MYIVPQDSVDSSECERYKCLMEMMGWFFFDLLILGYVEDTASGKTFRFPGGLQWEIYIEVKKLNYVLLAYIPVISCLLDRRFNR